VCTPEARRAATRLRTILGRKKTARSVTTPPLPERDDGAGNLKQKELRKLATYLGVQISIPGTTSIMTMDQLLIDVKAKWTKNLGTHGDRIELAPRRNSEE
jgi:hypothetical protein